MANSWDLADVFLHLCAAHVHVIGGQAWVDSVNSAVLRTAESASARLISAHLWPPSDLRDPMPAADRDEEDRLSELRDFSGLDIQGCTAKALRVPMRRRT